MLFLKCSSLQVFCDFHPGSIYSDRSLFQLDTLHSLGHGGYGTVFKGVLKKRPFDKHQPIQIAMKKINQDNFGTCTDEVKVWDIYLKASSEARLMNKLYHRNILSLVGLCSWPDLTILVELAPRGDLLSNLRNFRDENIPLSRKTIQKTLIQVI